MESWKPTLEQCPRGWFIGFGCYRDIEQPDVAARSVWFDDERQQWASQYGYGGVIYYEPGPRGVDPAGPVPAYALG